MEKDFMMELLAASVFPLIMFGGGVYLVFRGLRRKMGKSRPVRGAVSCRDPLRSLIRGEKCAYYRIVVEHYQRGAAPWKQVYSFESRAKFSVGGKAVDPTFASFSLPPQVHLEGYARPDPGLFDTVRYGYRRLREIADVTSEISPAEIIDESALKAVLSLPGAKERMKNHLKGALRICEYCLPVGGEVTVTPDSAAPGGGRLAGSLEYPLDISAYGGRWVMEEKAILCISLGSLFIAVSAALLYLLVS